MKAAFGDAPFDAVVHSAARLPDKDNEYLPRALRDNVAATANLVAAAARAKVRRFVFCSTIDVYVGEPRWPAGFREDDDVTPSETYAATKLAGERIVSIAARNGGVSAVSLRLGGLHGPGRNNGVVYRMLRSALDGDLVRVAEPDSVFRILFTDDAARAVECALQAETIPHDCYNVAGDTRTSLRQLAAEVIRVTSSRSTIDEGAGRGRRRDVDTSRLAADLDFTANPLSEHLAAFARELSGAPQQ